MTIIQKLRARKAIHSVAKQQGITVAQCRTDMTAAIEAAWATSDPTIRQRQVELVGEERIPTPEEFITLVTRQLQPENP